jgi:hypothetical protein
MKTHIKEDMLSHGKHVLLTKGATIPRIQLTVDPKCAAEINDNARKLPPLLTRAHTYNNGGSGHGHSSAGGSSPASALLRSALPEGLLKNAEVFVGSDGLGPNFAKKTIATMMHETEMHKQNSLK